MKGGFKAVTLFFDVYFWYRKILLILQFKIFLNKAWSRAEF